MGEQELKNIDHAVRAYRVVLEGAKAPAAVRPSPGALALPNKPSIAVLPFVNMGGDPEQDYFADGLVEDLITSLSKVAGFFVIARNSTFAYKGRAVDIRQVAKELGVRYVLEGSVRKAANRLRITGQLIEGASATHVWADKFEGAVEDIFDLQDRITESIVGAIEPSLRRAEIERARRKGPDRLDAYDLYLRAMPHAYANTPARTVEALRLLDEALALEPNYASAHGYAAWCHEQLFLRSGFHPEDRAAALKHAHIALSIGTDDPQALSIGAFVHAMITHDYDRAIGARQGAPHGPQFGSRLRVQRFGAYAERTLRSGDGTRLQGAAPQSVRSVELPPLSCIGMDPPVHRALRGSRQLFNTGDSGQS